MFIATRDTKLIAIHGVEWQCRRKAKGLSKSKYWTWLDSVTSGDPPVVDYSGETGYTIVECTDEDVQARLAQLSDYIHHSVTGTTYSIKYYVTKRDAEEITGLNGNSVLDENGEKTYVQSHFVGDNSAKDAQLLANEWTQIRAERDRLLANSDWTQGGDTPLASDKKTAWATYRTKLRDVPKDQKDKTTYASITWPSEPS